MGLRRGIASFRLTTGNILSSLINYQLWLIIIVSSQQKLGTICRILYHSWIFTTLHQFFITVLIFLLLGCDRNSRTNVILVLIHKTYISAVIILYVRWWCQWLCSCKVPQEGAIKLSVFSVLYTFTFTH